MEHFINDSESNKGTSHKSDGVNTGESTHVSKLSWLAHWKPSSMENASQDISKLPTPSVRSKQTSDENLLQGPHYSKSGTSEADRPASKDSEQDRQKDEEEFVEVRPSLLLPGECIMARSNKNKRMEKLCDLSRGPQITTLPSQASSLNVKHGSSSEMEPLDLNIFMSRDSGKGLALTAVNKDYVEAGISCDPLERITSARTKRSRNDVSPSCSAMDGCEDRKEMCASRTQSLDSEDLPAHADQPDPSQSDFSHPDQRASSRWVKRLKHSHLEAFGTKRSVDGDIYSHDKKIKLFSKVLNYGRSISNSELLSSACIEKQQQQLVEMVILPRQRRSAVGLMRENKDILSDPWIQRWRSAKSGGIQISSAEVICEPECSKVSIIEMQGKEFPSLGAMALMGKALTNFRPREFSRMGPFVAWKTKGH